MKIQALAKITSIELWIDDLRDPTDPEIQKRYGAKGTETWVKTVNEAIHYLHQGIVTHISFDNDLGEGQKEGRHLAAWIEEEAYFNRIPSMEWVIHSENPIGKNEIFMAMSNAEAFWEREQTI